MTKINDHANYPYMTKHPLLTGLGQGWSSLLTIWLSPDVGIFPSAAYQTWRSAGYDEACTVFSEVRCSHEEMLKVLAWQLPRVPDPEQLVPEELHQLVKEYHDSIR